MVRNTDSPGLSVAVRADEIAERAYEIYVKRGRVDGFDFEDWLRAERELSAAHRKEVSAMKGKGTMKQL